MVNKPTDKHIMTMWANSLKATDGPSVTDPRCQEIRNKAAASLRNVGKKIIEALDK